MLAQVYLPDRLKHENDNYCNSNSNISTDETSNLKWILPVNRLPARLLYQTQPMNYWADKTLNEEKTKLNLWGGIVCELQQCPEDESLHESNALVW